MTEFTVRPPTDREWLVLEPELEEIRSLERQLKASKNRLRRMVFALCGSDADIDVRTGMLRVPVTEEP